MSQTSSGAWYKLQLQKKSYADITCLHLPVKARPLLANLSWLMQKMLAQQIKLSLVMQFIGNLWVFQKAGEVRGEGSVGVFGSENTSFCPDIAFSIPTKVRVRHLDSLVLAFSTLNFLPKDSSRLASLNIWTKKKKTQVTKRSLGQWN